MVKSEYTNAVAASADRRPRWSGTTVRKLALALVAVAVLVSIMKMVHAQQYLLDLVTWIRGAG